MKQAAILFLLAVLFTAGAAHAGQGTDGTPTRPLAIGQQAPELNLAGPLAADQAKMLGVKAGQERYALSDIQAKALILVVYSMYCPYCQQEGPRLVALHELIASRGLEGKVGLVGLAAGNSPYEVNLYREKYGVGFPLFPDKDFAAYKALGQVGTPFFYVFKRQGKGFVVSGAILGSMESPQALLDRAVRAAGIQ
ncbi:TlpA disulfide reductase family protein [Fundidesulfovibrio butyratiphilus]